jgi:hypothetical protein
MSEFTIRDIENLCGISPGWFCERKLKHQRALGST